MGVVDLPQPVWGYIFIGLAAALLLALWVTDPRRRRRRDRFDGHGTGHGTHNGDE